MHAVHALSDVKGVTQLDGFLAELYAISHTVHAAASHGSVDDPL
jgi:hypothetical protein